MKFISSQKHIVSIQCTLLGKKKKKMQHPQGLCSLAPGYNMCILRGCSVSDSFVMVIGDQMALRRPVSAPSVLTLQAVNCVCFERWTVFATFTLGYNHAMLMSTCSCWTTSAIWIGSDCSLAGSWMEILMDCCTCWAQCISGVMLLSAVVCGTFPHP